MTITWSGHDGEGNTVTGSVAVTVRRPVAVPAAFGDGTNRAADLQAWLATQPDGSILDMTGLSIRANQTLLLANRSLTILGGKVYTDHPTGDSSTLAAPSVAARTRSHWTIRDSTITFQGHTVRGANPAGGIGDAAYVVALEAQNAFNLEGAVGTRLVDCTATDVYGDFAYLGRSPNGGAFSRDTVIEHLTGRRNGRQGISFTACTNTVVNNPDLADMRRGVFDLEPALAYWTVDGVTITGGVIGPHRLNLISSVGSGSAKVDNVTVSGLRLTSGTLLVTVSTGAVRRRNWSITDCVGVGAYGSPNGGLMHFTNLDGVKIRGNTQPLQVGRNMALVVTTGCTGVDVGGNTYPGGTAELREG